MAGCESLQSESSLTIRVGKLESLAVAQGPTNPGEVLAQSRGNFIQVLSKMNDHGQEQMDRINHLKSA